jgi:hypothetical protein
MLAAGLYDPQFERNNCGVGLAKLEEPLYYN